MFFEFCLKTFDQGKCIGSASCKTGQNTSVIQLADFSCGSLDNNVAECDLTISAQSDGCAAPDRYDGCPVKLFHLNSCDD